MVKCETVNFMRKTNFFSCSIKLDAVESNLNHIQEIHVMFATTISKLHESLMHKLLWESCSKFTYIMIMHRLLTRLIFVDNVLKEKCAIVISFFKIVFIAVC